MKLISIILLATTISGCTFGNVYSGAKVARDIGCKVTTEEWRSSVRDNQRVKTNICGDNL